MVPTGPFPTDQSSLIAIAAVVGTILAAVLLGLFVSGLNPTDPTVGRQTPTPLPTAEPSVEPSVEPEPSASAEPTPEPTPARRGTIAFGTGLDNAGNVTGETRDFTPSSNFAYAVSVPGGIGGTPIRNEITRMSDPVEVVANDELAVAPDDELIGYNLGSAAGFVQDWGPGEYRWRIYVGDELVAQGRFRLAGG